MRSPKDSMAADIAETRSSSMPSGKVDARGKPSVVTIAAPRTSGVVVTKFWRICLSFAVLIAIVVTLI
jgi:hypothetical protein